jgi:signal transduction histidine kinase
MDELALTIADDGVGFGAGSTVAAAFPGGSGNGLALHSTLLALVGGYLTVTAPPAEESGITVKLSSSDTDSRHSDFINCFRRSIHNSLLFFN